MTSLEVFVWAIAGGVFVAMLSAAAVLFQKETPSNKQLSRDFLLGAAFTGFLYPIIPETFAEIKGTISTTAGGLQENLAAQIAAATISVDPGVKIGPANF
jgi:formate/nitrite transporter FocA (FNT family)